MNVQLDNVWNGIIKYSFDRIVTHAMRSLSLNGAGTTHQMPANGDFVSSEISFTRVSFLFSRSVRSGPVNKSKAMGKWQIHKELSMLNNVFFPRDFQVSSVLLFFRLSDIVTSWSHRRTRAFKTDSCNQCHFVLIAPKKYCLITVLYCHLRLLIGNHRRAARVGHLTKRLTDRPTYRRTNKRLFKLIYWLINGRTNLRLFVTIKVNNYSIYLNFILIVHCESHVVMLECWLHLTSI